MKPYAGEGSKKEQVGRMFDAIAPRYDMLDHLLSLNLDRGWRRRTARMVKASGASAVLDVAAGTGDLTIAMARRMPGARITGCDISEEMMRIGRAKAERRGVADRVEFLYGDAEELPFETGSFDAVTAAFGVRNFQDVGAGLREMHRILRPGGRIFVLEFSAPRGKIFGPLYRFYFRRVLPFVGGLFSRDRAAYEYLPGSVGEFPPPEEFLAMMESAGFAECASVSLTRGVAVIYSGNKI